MMINSPSDGGDAFGGLGLALETGGNYLDSYIAKGYVHGYSTVRQLISTATVAYEARRTTDNAVEDIGFANNLVDTDALSTFAGSVDTRMQVFYDQVGSSDGTGGSNNANQHILINSGTLETTPEAIPCSTTQASFFLYTLPANVPLTNFTVFCVVVPVSGRIGPIANANVQDSIYANQASSIFVCNIANANDQTVFTFTSNVTHSLCVVRNGANVEYFVDNVSIDTDTVPTDDFDFERLFLNINAGNKITEVHVFNTNLDEVDRNSFNVNLDDAHGI